MLDFFFLIELKVLFFINIPNIGLDPGPDPHGSVTFAWIRIRSSENSKLDQDPYQE